MLSLRLFDSITWEFLSVSICTQKRIRHHSESNSSDQKCLRKGKDIVLFLLLRTTKTQRIKRRGIKSAYTTHRAGRGGQQQEAAKTLRATY